MDDDRMPGENVKITVKLFASFRQDRFNESSKDYASGTNVAGVLADLKIDAEELGMAFIGGRHADLERTLQNGDVLSLFPLLGGG